MALASDSRTYDALLTTTLEDMAPFLNDNVFNSLVITAWMNMNGRIKVHGGGERIEEPLLYGKNTTAKNYAGYDTLDVTPQDGITKAFYDWRQASVSVSISGAEMRKNKGSKTKAIDLLGSKVMQADLSIRDLLNTQLIGDPTSEATQNQGVDQAGFEDYFLSIAALVQDDPTTTHTIGGIPQDTNSWWQNQAVDNTGTVNWSDSADHPAALAKVRTLYNNCSKGTDHPDLGLMDQASYQYYEGMASDKHRLYDTRFAQLGFTNLKYNNATLVYDEHYADVSISADSNTGVLFFLNSKYITWHVHEDANLTPTPFIKPANQDARVAQILVMGQLTTGNRRRNGVLYDIAA